MVEPIFGVLGAVAVSFATIILPYALSFAAGAMIYIVSDFIYSKIEHFIQFTLFYRLLTTFSQKLMQGKLNIKHSKFFSGFAQTTC